MIALDASLPHTNEVWSKVICSQASVILFTGGGGLGFPACITGHMTRVSCHQADLPPTFLGYMSDTLPFQLLFHVSRRSYSYVPKIAGVNTARVNGSLERNKRTVCRCVRVCP